ncbi:ATP-binding cassette domain-containing protein [Myroides sp. M-43]|uniref:ATP-binding cassette domain-containing protein n=1 Tax=Myroides oncorhynchi TaxID=2893756 RepID=UPI001E337A12|nr:ATP-binding cassette domain-containing protein [Myroides oncorhynchi]MCC9042026.1 ATP-binding cassette domain-containing protein [Myroides oncorhynchi]
MSFSHSLHVDSLSYSIDNKLILRGVYLSATTGDILNIRGRNGSGKSTLLNILFGSIKPNYHHIKIDDQVIMNRHKLNKYFSYKPQFDLFPKHLKVCDVIKENTIRDTPLYPYFNTKIKDLSTGEKQLIQTLYVLDLPQPICLLDEPFAGVSPILQEFISQVIKEKARHKIIILTDHNTDLVDSIVTKVMILDNGVLTPK